MNVDLGIPKAGETMVAGHWDPLVVDAAWGARQASAKNALYLAAHPVAYCLILRAPDYPSTQNWEEPSLGDLGAHQNEHHRMV